MIISDQFAGLDTIDLANLVVLLRVRKSASFLFVTSSNEFSSTEGRGAFLV